MENEHQPEVLVITGASAGVGRDTARAFTKRGAWVGLLARGRDGLEAARREVEGELRPIGVWVNNGMVSVFSPSLQMAALAHRGIPLQSADFAAKHPIQGLTNSLRCELLHDQSKVQVCMMQMPNLPPQLWATKYRKSSLAAGAALGAAARWKIGMARRKRKGHKR